MKSICLVERVKWKFAGNMNPHAFDFGDVNNDKDNEFVIGNLKGELAVFKGISVSGQPYMTCSGLGTITCVAVGDIKNSGKNSIVCVNAEGQCHIFDIASNPITDDENIKTSSNNTQAPTMRPIINASPKVIEKPTMTLSVPVNCNRILIADIDGDGVNEIILARTDRVLHVFNFQIPPSTIDSTASKEQQNILTRSSDTANRGSKEKQSANSMMPHLEEKKKWFLDEQIASLSIAKDPTTSSPLLIVGQPGGQFMMIEKNMKGTLFSTQVSGDQSGEESAEVSTEIVRGTRFNNGKCIDVVALITMDGKFTIYDLQSSSMLHHELQDTHKLFGMTAIDLCINEDNLDNDPKKSSEKYVNVFVVCAWNGSTYVIDHDFNVVKFEFEGRVCAFAAGQYAITPGHNVNCFMYVDFEDQITVYYNLRINTEPVTNFMEIMRGQFDKFDELLRDKAQDYDQEKDALSNGSYQTTSNITEFFHQCLYQLDDYKNMKAKLQREIEELKRKKREEELLENKESVSILEDQESPSNKVQDAEAQELEGNKEGNALEKDKMNSNDTREVDEIQESNDY